MHRRHRETIDPPAITALVAHRRLFLSARRHADRRVLAGGQAARRRLGSGSGRGTLSGAQLNSGVPIPNFALSGGTLRSELRNQRDTSKFIDLVWLWFRSPHLGLVARMKRASEPPH